MQDLFHKIRSLQYLHNQTKTRAYIFFPENIASFHVFVEQKESKSYHGMAYEQCIQIQGFG